MHICTFEDIEEKVDVFLKHINQVETLENGDQSNN